MQLFYDKDSNVCEYVNDNTGDIVHVLSDETGLWFNKNDIFSLFGVIKTTKY